MATGSLTKKSFNGGEWNPTLWERSDLQAYATGNKAVINFVPEIEGSISNRPGLHYVATTKDSGSSVSRLVDFTFSTQQAYILEFGDLYVRFYANNGQVVSGGAPLEVVTPYAAADVALLKFEQSADVLYITHPSYPPATLSRTAPTTFVYAAISFSPTQAPPTGLTAASGSGTYSYSVTAVSSSGQESVASNTVSMNRSNYLTWTAPAGTAPQYYKVYEMSSGVNFYIGQSTTTTFYALSSPTTYVAQSPSMPVSLFNAADNYPGVVAFYDQRLVFCRTNTQPQTLFGSVIGDFDNMDYSSPTIDTDAFQFTINSRQVNEIRWFVALQQGIIGTSGGEWLLQPATGSATVTPSSVSLTKQSTWGCSDVPPILLGNALLFVDGSSKAVRTLSYSVYTNGYDGTDVSVLAKHLFDTYGITQWAYQQYPDSIIWAVRADGVLLGLTYFAEDKVTGWHRHTTQGLFESVASIPLPDGSKQVWFIVNRTIGGQTVRYVEYMDARNFTTINDAFFVDAGLSYSGTPDTVFSGLDHLDGQTVVALADGNVVTGLTVSSGSVTLPNPASDVHIGLPYTCQLETLDFTTQVDSGEMSSFSRMVKSVTINLHNTREVFLGSSGGKLVEVPFRTRELPGTAVQLFTGEKANISIAPGGYRSTSVVVQTENPLPIRIVSLTAHVTYGDR